MNKKIISLILACTVSLGLIGCGKDSSGDITSNGNSATEANYDPFGKYEEPVLVTGVMEYTSLTDDRIPKDTTPDNQAFMASAKEKLNIDFQYLWKAPPEQYEQKLGIALASDELPDIMKVYANDYHMLKENEQLMDLTEALKYASPALKEFIERDPSVLESLKDDCKIYAIPQYSDKRRTMNVMYIRKDWLDELGLQVPKTVDELENVAKAFVEKKGAQSGLAIG